MLPAGLAVDELLVDPAVDGVAGDESLDEESEELDEPDLESELESDVLFEAERESVR